MPDLEAAADPHAAGQSAAPEPLRLTELWQPEAGARPDAAAIWDPRRAYLALHAAREWLGAWPRDTARRLRRRPSALLRTDPGMQAAAGASRIALYVHYSASGRISQMVLRQLVELAQLDFSVVFITMADGIPEADWQAVRQVAALLVRRANSGLDFGAWQDVIPQVQRRWPDVQELLLANDSVLGPIHGLRPMMAVMRGGGDGLFGLTESLQGGAHLQSYFLLASGTRAVRDMMRFLRELRISHSKWILVQRGEVRLSAWMRQRGHRVAALFGYDRLIQAALADPVERERLQAVHSMLGRLEGIPSEAAVRVLRRWPLNPTHHLWRVLVTKFGYPFVKTELVLRNPVGIKGTEDWPAVVPPGSSDRLDVLQSHLWSLQMPGKGQDGCSWTSPVSDAPDIKPRAPEAADPRSSNLPDLKSHVSGRLGRNKQP